MEIWTPSNTWFLGPTRVHKRNGSWISSAIFAGLTIETDRPTDHAGPSVTIGHMYVVLRCSLMIDLRMYYYCCFFSLCHYIFNAGEVGSPWNLCKRASMSCWNRNECPSCCPSCTVWLLITGWPLTWKSSKSQEIKNWSGKSQGKWEVRGTIISFCRPVRENTLNDKMEL